MTDWKRPTFVMLPFTATLVNGASPLTESEITAHCVKPWEIHCQVRSPYPRNIQGGGEKLTEMKFLSTSSSSASDTLKYPWLIGPK